MIFLGIDPGTALTGFGFVRQSADGSLSAIDYGVIATDANDKMENRLSTLYDELSKKILLHQPQCGAVEKLFFRRNVTTAISVGQARGVILLSFAKAELQLAEFTPMEVKQSVVGYGGADKRQVQQMVKAILNLTALPKPDDAADALALAICCAHSYRYLELTHG